MVILHHYRTWAKCFWARLKFLLEYSLHDVLFFMSSNYLIWKQIEKNGKKQWKKVEVKLEDHVKTPIFPSNLSNESYDEYFDDYISSIATKRFPQDKPLWEVHVIKYPNSNAAGNLIFKLHHALGDEYSLVGFLSCLQRYINPSLSLTFPSRLPCRSLRRW